MVCFRKVDRNPSKFTAIARASSLMNRHKLNLRIAYHMSYYAHCDPRLFQIFIKPGLQLSTACYNQIIERIQIAVGIAEFSMTFVRPFICLGREHSRLSNPYSIYYAMSEGRTRGFA